MNEIKLCDYGCGHEALFVLSNGGNCCSEHGNQCPEKIRINSETNKQRIKSKGHPKGATGKTPWNKGKTISDYIEYYGEEKWQEIASRQAIHKNSWDCMTEEQKDLFRIERSRDMKKRYESGWQSKAGRCKKIWYESPIAGKISVDGFWELFVAMYFDFKKYDWRRNTKRFGYIHLNGKDSNYTPDFWVKDFESYVEVKGYEDELTKCKLKQFKEPVQLWKKEKIKEIELEMGITVKQLRKEYVIKNGGRELKKCKSCDGFVCVRNKSGICLECIKINARKNRTHTKRNKSHVVCKICGVKLLVMSKSGCCKKCVDRRRVKNRPSKEELEKTVNETPMTKIGEKYGVVVMQLKSGVKIMEYNYKTGGDIGLN